MNISSNLAQLSLCVIAPPTWTVIGSCLLPSSSDWSGRCPSGNLDARDKFTTVSTCGWCVRASCARRAGTRTERLHLRAAGLTHLWAGSPERAAGVTSSSSSSSSLLEETAVVPTVQPAVDQHSLLGFLHGEETRSCSPSMAVAPAPTRPGPEWLLAASADWTPRTEASPGGRRSCCAPSSPPSSSCTASPSAAAPAPRSERPPAGGSCRTWARRGLRGWCTNGRNRWALMVGLTPSRPRSLRI